MNTQLIARNRNIPAALIKGRGAAPIGEHPTGTMRTPVEPPDSIAPSAEFLPTTEPGEVPTFDSTMIDPNANPYSTSTESPTVPAYDPNAPLMNTAAASGMTGDIAAPYLAEIERNKKKRDILRTMPITNKDGSTTSSWKAFSTEADPEGEEARKKFTDTDGRAKSGLSAFLQSLAANPGLRNVRSWGDLAKSVTYSGAAGIAGAVHSSWNEEQKRDAEMAKLDGEDARLKDEVNERMKLATQQTQIDNINNDNLLNKEKFENKAQQDADKLSEQKRGNWYKQNQFFDPTKATPAQVKQLAEIGETPFSVGHYDVTKPNVKVMNGVSYQWNSSTRSFDESNIPQDGSKAIVEYKVKDPNTDVEYTYSTTSEKAAALKTQLRSSGLQIQAASERQQVQLRQQAATANVNNEQEYNNTVNKNAAERVRLVNEGNGKINQSLDLENQAKIIEQQAETSAVALEEEAQKLDETGDAANKTKASQIRIKAASARDEARKLKLQASKLREEGNAAVNNAQNLKDPPKPAAVRTPASGGKYSGQYFPNPSVLKSAFPNKNEAEIRQIIEANGGKFKD